MKSQMQAPSIEDFPDLSQDDFLVHSFVSKELQAHDKELFQLKWWDYRFMTPYQATLTYIDAFQVAARNIYARDIDSERAQYIQITGSEQVKRKLLDNDIRMKRHFSGFWRGRQVADVLGMPYHIYLELALNYRLRAWQRTHLPTPSQIYRDRDVQDVSQKWDEMKESRVYYADHHAYMAQNYDGSENQNLYYTYLIDRAAKNVAHETRTLADMIDADRISYDFVRNRIDDRKFEEVVAFLK